LAIAKAPWPLGIKPQSLLGGIAADLISSRLPCACEQLVMFRLAAATAAAALVLPSGVAALEISRQRLERLLDCVNEGNHLCEPHSLGGLEALKYGDPSSNLQDYVGEREFDDLNVFAGNLGPMCTPSNFDACDDEEKTKIKGLQAMDPSLLSEKVEQQKGRIKEVEAEFQTFMEELVKKQEAAEKKHEEAKAIKDGGLVLMKAVLTHGKNAKAGSAEF